MSGSFLGGVIGAVIGFFVSGGNPMGALYGWSAGSAIGGMLSSGPTVEGPRLSDLKPQSSEYGRPIPIVYGTVAMGGNVIWAPDYIEVKSESGGGKGSPTVENYTYFAHFAVAFAEGECNIGRMWAGPEKRLIWDGVSVEGGSVRIYRGTEDQLPDPLIESYLGVGNVPAYRGTCYAVFERFPLAKDGNAIPFITAEVGRAKLGNPAPPVSIAPLATAINTSPIAAIDPVTGWIWSVSAPFLGTDYTVTVFSDFLRQVIWQGTFTAPWPILGVGNITISPDGAQVFTVFQPAAGGNQEAMVAEFFPGVKRDDGTVKTPPAALGIEFWGNQTGGMNPVYPHTIYCTNTFVWITYAFTNANYLHIARFTRTEPHDDRSYVEMFFDFGIGTPTQMVGDDDYLAVYGATGPSGQNIAVIDAAGGSLIAKTGAAIDGLNNYQPLSYDPKRRRVSAPVPGGLIAIDATTGEVSNHSITLPADAPVGVTINLLFDVRLDKYVYAQREFGANSNKMVLYVIDPDRFTVDSFWVHDVGDMIVGPLLEGVVKTGDPYVITFSNSQVYRLYLGGTTAGPSSLGAVVADLSERAGLTIDQIDVDALTDMVDGYSIARQTTVRNAIDALRPVYYFDAVESEGKVKFVKRGGAPVATIDVDDLDAHNDGQSVGDPLLTTRQMEVELPRVVNVNYMLAATDYSPATKLAKRLVGASGNETTLDLPLVLTDTKAQEVADVNLQVAWVQRLTYSFSLPRKYSELEPTDHIVVKGNGMRLTKATRTPQGVIKCEAMADGATFYTPNTTVTETPPNEQTVYIPGPTSLELM